MEAPKLYKLEDGRISVSVGIRGLVHWLVVKRGEVSTKEVLQEVARLLERPIQQSAISATLTALCNAGLIRKLDRGIYCAS